MILLLTLGLGLVACSSAPDEAGDEPPPIEPTEPHEEPADPVEPTPEPTEPSDPDDTPPPEPAPEPAPGPESQIEITDQHIAQLADVLIATEDIEAGIEQDLAEAETHEDIQAIEQQVMAELQSEVESAGLTMEEYEAIVAELQVNPELFQQLEGELDQRGRSDLLQAPAM